MMTFDRAVRVILDLEGGYSLDSLDPEGETKFGISKRSYPDLNIAELTESAAIEIYYRDFWAACRCPSFGGSLGLVLFDAAVNQGASAAICMLQAELKVSEDGILGPQTIAAYQRQGLPMQDYAARRMLTYGLNPNFTRYGHGWSRRLMKVVTAALTF